jgi:uncharacterized protein (TIGR02147 family)
MVSRIHDFFKPATISRTAPLPPYCVVIFRHSFTKHERFFYFPFAYSLPYSVLFSTDIYRGVTMPDIYGYNDYRAFLQDYFAERKAAGSGFSHQNFARKALIKSKGFLLHVMKKERNLTKPVLLKVARAIGLTPAETEYFEDLVSFDQAKNITDKNFYFAKIASRRSTVRCKNLDDMHYAFFATWYHSVIRELITLISPNTDIAKIAKFLIPPVSVGQIRESLKLMFSLGLVKKNSSGNYVQSEPFISAGGPVRNMAIVNFQKAMLALASQAWDYFPENELNMNTLTITMSEDLVGVINKEIALFKKKLLALVANDGKKATRVHHMNISFFPVSRRIKEA